MTSDNYNAGLEAGRRQAAQELQPLVDEISDAIFMFNDIEKARELPAYANVIQQYLATGRRLKKLLEQFKKNWHTAT